MSHNELLVTVVGWAATTPREVVGTGVPFTSFRVGSTPRHFDTRLQAWTDGKTEWVTVKAFRDVAFNVAASIRKGDPVVVHGRLRTEEWTSDAGLRTTLTLEALALGHDLTRGTSRFARTITRSAADDAVVLEDLEVQLGAMAVDSEDREDGEDAVDPWAVDVTPDEDGEHAPDAVPAGAGTASGAGAAGRAKNGDARGAVTP